MCTTAVRRGCRHPDELSGQVLHVHHAAMVAHGWTLLEVRANPPTLEDLFVRLIGAGATEH